LQTLLTPGAQRCRRGSYVDFLGPVQGQFSPLLSILEAARPACAEAV